MIISRLGSLTAAALLICVGVSCTGDDAKHSSDGQSLARQLDDLGLWRGLPDSVRNANILAVENGAHPWATELAGDVEFVADGEDLAEGGVEEFVAAMRVPLAALGVPAVVSTVQGADTGEYIIAINGEVIDLYDAASWNSAVVTEQPWYASTVRPLAALNRSLKQAGAKERFFVLYPGGNDGIALLIDPEIVDLLKRAGLASGDDLPTEAL